MKHVYITIVAVLLLSLPGNAWSKVHAKSGKLVTVNGQVRLDDTRNFTFKSLSVFVQSRQNTESSWKPLGSFTPTEKGQISIPLPSGSLVSIEITTSDPTVRRGAAKTDELDFYVMEFNRRVTVLNQELSIPLDPTEPVVWTADLQRGAAFSLCRPDGMKSGSVQFRRRLDRYEDAINLWSFSDSAPLQDAMIGGIVPGLWQVRILDADESERLLEQVDLRRGQISATKCE